MGLRYTALASGSSGNASLIEADGFGLLLDIGLGPRQLSQRLAAVRASWLDVQAVLLTHTHSDHWNDRTFAYLLRHRLPVYCHPGHHSVLQTYSPSFRALQAANLIRDYGDRTELSLSPALRCRPIALRHDSGLTFGFRLETTPGLLSAGSTMAYLADLGCWNEGLVDVLSNVELLALEFNHDVDMQYASGRQPRLIARVLGDDGHLSNAQAAELLRAVLSRSEPGRLRHVVQLHLSRDCNRPILARTAAQAVLSEIGTGIELHTASQDVPLPTLHLGFASNGHSRPRSRARRRSTAAPPQPWLPGFEAG
jgi:phosphoribosyl 1,2-cyclic phosphodiesterase